MSKYKVFISIPGTYDGMSVWVEAASAKDAKKQVEWLLAAASTGTARGIVVD